MGLGAMGKKEIYGWDRAEREGEKAATRAAAHYKPASLAVKLSGPTAKAAIASLPVDLHPVFRELYMEYAEVARYVHGTAFVSPRVIAELVRLGWRKEKEGSGT